MRTRFLKSDRVFDVIEGVHATLSIFGVEIAGRLGLGLGVLAPLAGFAANLMALGAGYAAARNKIARRALISGFAHGVAMGADRRTWSYAKQMFWQYNAYRYAPPNGRGNRTRRPEIVQYGLGLRIRARPSFNRAWTTGHTEREILLAKHRPVPLGSRPLQTWRRFETMGQEHVERLVHSGGCQFHQVLC